MAFMRITQRPNNFAALPDDGARDAIIGRTKDGARLDLTGTGTRAHDEPADPPPALSPTSHVLKAGPRGVHDAVQIFRRGMPFMEANRDGQLRVGLNFCSFQAALDQFDVVFSHWMMNRTFPPQPGGAEAGVDALMDPARQLTAIEKVGFFFVPPHHEEGLAAAVFAAPPDRKPKTGRLVVHKRVVDQSDSARRFERRGFVFQIVDGQGQPVPGSQFETTPPAADSARSSSTSGRPTRSMRSPPTSWRTFSRQMWRSRWTSPTSSCRSSTRSRSRTPPTVADDEQAAAEAAGGRGNRTDDAEPVSLVRARPEHGGNGCRCGSASRSRPQPWAGLCRGSSTRALTPWPMLHQYG